MDHQNCRYLLSSLSEYVDGELGGEVCAEIEKHLQGCDNCRIVVDSLRKTVYLYHSNVEEPSVPADVRERLFKCLDLNEFLEKKS
jgi:predicted anti-sigma-YlaC factor YlaD